MLKSEREQRELCWDCRAGTCLFLNSRFFSLACNSFNPFMRFLAEVWGHGTACLRWHGRKGSEEQARGVLTTCCAAALLPHVGISQGIGWCRPWPCWEQLAAETQRFRKGVLASYGRPACFHIMFHPQNTVMVHFQCGKFWYLQPYLAHASKTQCNSSAAAGNSVKFAFFTWIW